MTGRRTSSSWETNSSPADRAAARKALTQYRTWITSRGRRGALTTTGQRR